MVGHLYKTKKLLLSVEPPLQKNRALLSEKVNSDTTDIFKVVGGRVDGRGLYHVVRRIVSIYSCSIIILNQANHVTHCSSVTKPRVIASRFLLFGLWEKKRL